MSRVRSVAVAVCSVGLLLGFGRESRAQVTWDVDNTTNIGGNAVTLVRAAPTVVSTPFGNGLKFDGDDGVIVNADPVAGAAAFTVEMLFRPDPIVNASSNVPRILHLQSANPPDHRATLEGRIAPNNQQWWLDAFLKSQPVGANPFSLALMDASKLHPLSQWYNFTMTYDGAAPRLLERPTRTLRRANRLNYGSGANVARHAPQPGELF